MVDTIKFSQMTAGGDLPNDSKTPGLLNSTNVLFNNPWTFLPPGPTGDRPIPAVPMYYRLRLNTTLEIYEYYDPTIPIWVELSGSGTGTVNPGVANDIAFYAASGQAVSPIASMINAVLMSNGSGVPFMSTTLPVGLNIPSAIITASTAALTSGSVVAVPASGNDIVNKSYADGLFASGVQSLTGTTNQISFSSSTGNITASLPQDIALGSTPTFAGLTLTSIPLGATSGGTSQSTYVLGDILYSSSVNTLNKLAGNITTAKQYLSQTGTGVLSAAPIWSSITGADITGSALTKTDDTNVTLTLGGTPATALLRASSLTLGWAGLLAVSRGGTGVSSITTTPTATSWAGWDSNKNFSANSLISGFNTTVSAAGNTTLTVASAAVQEITGSSTQTITMPVASTLVAGIPYVIINNSSGNVTVNSSGGNLIQTMAANTTLYLYLVLASGTTASSWNAGYLFDNGAGVLSITGTANQVIASASTGPVILSLPQSIAAASSPTFNGLTLTSLNFGSTALTKYESGTFSPGITALTPGNLSVSYTTQYGIYQIIGNTLHYFISLSFTPTYTTASGNIVINNFPVATSVGTNTIQAAVGGAGFTAVASATGYVFTPSSTTASGAVFRSALASANLNISAFATGLNAVITLMGSYTI